MAQYLGQVVGTKMQRTVKVCVTSLKLHPVILKYWNHKKVYLAHDANSECRNGDMVLIKETRKMSKRKWFRVIDIVEKAPQLPEEYVQDLKRDPKWMEDNLKLLGRKRIMPPEKAKP